MRAAGIERFGDDVRPLTLPDPRPLAPDEVLIDVRAAGVANWDEFVRTGGWDVGIAPPMALGVAASGVVAAVGDEVGDWAAGDEVMTHPLPLREQGTWAERLVAAAGVLAPKPPGVTWEEAAVFPVPALTAAQVLDEVGAGGDDRLLVNGGGGVTGEMVVALARLRGVAVVAVAGPRSRERLLSLGVEAVLDYHDDEWPRAAREAGVSAAVNAVTGGEPAALSTVADGGRLVTITGAPPEPERGISITNLIVEPVGAQLRELAEPLGRRELQVDVAEVHELGRAREALAGALSGRAGGAIALTPG